MNITVRHNGKFKLFGNKKELNTLTIALALFNIPDMEDELKEQGLTEKDVTFDHLKLFSHFADATGLYPQAPRTPKKKGEEK